MEARLFTSILVLSLTCIGIPTISAQERYRNLPTRDSQRKLVAGLKPTQPKMRFRRDLNAPLAATPLKNLQGRNYSNTPGGRRGAAEIAKVRRNVRGSGWTLEAAPGRERVIFASNEGKEQEFEYDTRELAALAAQAMPRGINNASEGGTKGHDDDQSSLFMRAGWSNAIDSRIVKPINATYPINHRVLMRIGELNGEGCSGALVGRRLVLTAAHCIIKEDLSYNTHTYRARRSGANALRDCHEYRLLVRIKMGVKQLPRQSHMGMLAARLGHSAVTGQCMGFFAEWNPRLDGILGLRRKLYSRQCLQPQ
ncbi:MAG TPA: trypsin-like serine protease [Pyrinomonadaceae bacterium]|nr:trypsin-like serine protease [Pyrinomonadaceae bacterium]